MPSRGALLSHVPSIGMLPYLNGIFLAKNMSSMTYEFDTTHCCIFFYLLTCVVNCAIGVLLLETSRGSSSASGSVDGNRSNAYCQGVSPLGAGP